jgi:hypothetical protein
VLTDVVIKKAPKKAARYEIKDASRPGLRLVVQPSGAKSFVYRYTFGDVYRKLTLGAYPTVDLKAAIAEHRKAADDLAAGNDPAIAFKKKRGGDVAADDTVTAYVARTPLITRLGHIGPVLLGSSLRLFLSGSSRNLSLFHRHPMLTLTLRSASSQACSSASVMSGSAAMRSRRASSCGASFGLEPPPDGRAVTSPVFRRRIKAL